SMSRRRRGRLVWPRPGPYEATQLAMAAEQRHPPVTGASALLAGGAVRRDRCRVHPAERGRIGLLARRAWLHRRPLPPSFPRYPTARGRPAGPDASGALRPAACCRGGPPALRATRPSLLARRTGPATDRHS